MSRSTTEILTDALAHLTTTVAYGERDLSDQLVIDAVCMRLSAAIETLSTLDPPMRDHLFGEEWPLMWGMRNRIAHGYLLIDPEIVRETLAQDVRGIINRIRANLPGSDQS